MVDTHAEFIMRVNEAVEAQCNRECHTGKELFVLIPVPKQLPFDINCIETKKINLDDIEISAADEQKFVAPDGTVLIDGEKMGVVLYQVKGKIQ